MAKKTLDFTGLDEEDINILLNKFNKEIKDLIEENKSPDSILKIFCKNQRKFYHGEKSN